MSYNYILELILSNIDLPKSFHQFEGELLLAADSPRLQGAVAVFRGKSRHRAERANERLRLRRTKQPHPADGSTQKATEIRNCW